MKRYFCILLLLLLTGCGGQQPTSRDETPELSTGSGEYVETFTENAGEAQETETAATPETEVSPRPDPKIGIIEDILSSMTLAEKVGQLFFACCPAADQAQLAAQYALGGYLLFGQDFKDSAGNWLTREQFTSNISSYQAASRIALLIGVDEEGGTVARATRNPNLFPQKRRSPQEIFAEGGMSALRQDACEIGNALLTLGINVNFAPVADVSTDPNDFIYDRSLGQDAQTTAICITYVLQGMNECAVQYTNETRSRALGAVLKHFPGYGSNADTHTGVAIDQRPYEQFVAEDLLPFQAGIEAGAGAVLVSHNIVESMDAALPASLSPEVHRILREELGFEGVILTDDLAMDAVEAYAQDGSAAVLAVLAGNDMIVTADFTAQIPQVITAVENGQISQALIDSAVKRVLAWKYDLGLLGNDPKTTE